MKQSEYTATHHFSPSARVWSAGSRQMKMMQATKASSTLSRPGTVDRKPLTSPGLARVSPTSAAYATKHRQDMAVAATGRGEPPAA